MKTLSNIAYLSNNIIIRFAMLCCNLKESHKLIQKVNANTNYINKSKSLLVDKLCNRFKIPNNFYKLSKNISLYNDYLYDFSNVSPKIIMEIFNAFNCWKTPEKIEYIILANKANLLTNRCNISDLFVQEKILRQAFIITNQIKTNNIINDGFIGKNISIELYKRRLKILKKKWNMNN